MELPFDPAVPLLGLYSKNPETQVQKNLGTPMFIAAQFTIASNGSNVSAHQQISGSKTMVYLHNGILCSREKEGAYTLCNSMHGTGEPYAK